MHPILFILLALPASVSQAFHDTANLHKAGRAGLGERQRQGNIYSSLLVLFFQGKMKVVALRETTQRTFFCEKIHSTFSFITKRIKSYAKLQ